MMKHIAIIVAGGTGKRMGSELPKQFLQLKAKPLLYHSLRIFSDAGQIIVSLNDGYHEYWQKMQNGLPGVPQHMVVSGGATRYQSVLNALNAVEVSDALVSIHDAARPLATSELAERCYLSAIETGSAVPVIPVEDTIREIGDDGSKIIDRNRLFRVQTPQSFHLSLIRKAYQQPYEPGFTDDASLLEKMGVKVNFIEGEKNNIKVTHPGDLQLAEMIMGS